jgi:hypothetical protein
MRIAAITGFAVPEGDVLRPRRRAPLGGRDWTEEHHGGRAHRGREVRQAGVSAHCQARSGDQRRQRCEIEAGDDGRVGQTGGFRNVGTEPGLARAGRDQHPVPVRGERGGYLREAVCPPPPARRGGARMNQDGAGAVSTLRRRGLTPRKKIEVVRVRRDSLLSQEAAPAPDLVFRGAPSRPARIAAGRVGEGDQPRRVQRAQQLVAGRAAAVQVHRDFGRRSGPRHRLELADVDEPVGSAAAGDERCQYAGSG